jgi:very-short-patch-repair endonuclease
MAKSELEREFLTRWRQLAPDYPEPVAEYPFAWLALRRRWRFDFAFIESKLAVEIDGGQWAPHGGRHNTDADREKLNVAALLGWRVMRFSGSMLREDPCGVVDMIVEALCPTP